MINFRYHLISIVAVLLALSIGVVLGTGTLGGPLLEDVRQNLEELRAENRERLQQISDLRAELGAGDEFATAIEPYISRDQLVGEVIVLFEFDGTPGNAIEALVTSIGEAGGSVISTIEIGEKFALEDAIDRDELALAVGSTTGDDEALRQEAAALIGSRAASSAAQRGTALTSNADERLDELLDQLEESGFLSVDRVGDGRTVPFGASFLVVGGNEDLPRWEIGAFATELGLELAATGAQVMAAEPSRSQWEIISSVRGNGEARDAVGTAERVETVAGRIGVILGLERAEAGVVGHYGTSDGADEVIPPLPSPQ